MVRWAAARSPCFRRRDRVKVQSRLRPRREEGNWIRVGDRLQLWGVPINATLPGSVFFWFHVPVAASVSPEIQRLRKLTS